MITQVVAMDRRGAIGRDNQLPWHLRDDLKHFKSVTIDKPILMGRRTYESIGRPLPGRHNIVLSRSIGQIDGISVARSLGEALALSADAPEMMVIGGAEIYALTLAKTSRIWLTTVDTVVDGADRWFPPLSESAWRIRRIAEFAASEHNDFDFVIDRLDR